MAAQNPESGTVSYTYDANGNLATRADARLIHDGVTPLTCSYTYDALNRVLTRSYNDGTPAQNFTDRTPTVTYTYDTLPQRKGHLTSVSSSVSSYHYTSYDAVGRVTGSSQVTEGQTYQMSYEYNLAGQLKSQTYPSGRVVATEYDAAGRIAGVKNAMSASYYAGAVATDAVNRIQYSAHGAVSALRLGNGLWEHTNYNSRLQPEQIGLGTQRTNSSVLQLDYSYGVVVNGVLDQTQNSGNVQSQTITLPGGLSLAQSYEYDELNRLKVAQENNGASWKQVYAYDPYGNRTFAAGTTIPALPPEVTDAAVNPAISTATNRISDGQGYGYDAAGNLTTLSGQQLTYDGESRQVSANVGGEYGLSLYRYDGDGRRVKKVTGSGTTTIYVYNVLGQVVAEYSTASPAPAGGTSYLTADHLGTPRVITNADGGVQARHDYLPFGEEISINIGGRSTGQGYLYGSGLPDPLRHKFTGTYERDVETELDYAQARYYASQQGRFTSPDPLLASGKPAIPQSWNRYAYCLNNPLLFIDPSGLDWGYRQYQENGKTMREFKWFEGEVTGGYTPYNDVSYTFGDGRAAWLGNDGSWGWIDPIRPEPAPVSDLLYDGVIQEIGNRTAPIPEATLLFGISSASMGYAIAGSPLLLLDSAAAAGLIYSGLTESSDAPAIAGSIENRQRAIDAVVREDFSGVRFSANPTYNPDFTGFGRATPTSIEIGRNPSNFSSRMELRDSLVHEELHHRLWRRGVTSPHHPSQDAFIRSRIDRYFRMRGWK